MARSERSSRLRRPLIALIIVAALALAGCAPNTTMRSYAAGDGARADLANQVRAENVLIVSEGEGSPGTLVGSFVNEWSQDTEVSLTVDGQGESITITLPGSATVILSPDHESIVLPSIPVPPGGVLSVQLSTTESGSVTLPIPVLDGTIDPYQDYVPDADA